MQGIVFINNQEIKSPLLNSDQKVLTAHINPYKFIYYKLLYNNKNPLPYLKNIELYKMIFVQQFK